MNYLQVIAEEFPEIEINDVVKDILECFFTTSENMFITGPAGCGKSTILKILQNKKVYSKNIVVLSPTGISAVNVSGITIHSFFKFPPSLINDNDIFKCHLDDDRIKLLENIDAFIIDEVSMINPNMFDAIDLYLRYHLDDKRPFAGKRIILFGDLYQLPPVVKKFSNEYKILTELYGENGFYFFNSLVYKQTMFHKFLLEKVYRQSDMEFVEILHRIRKGTQTGADIKKINSHVIDEGDFMDMKDQYLYVAYVNAIADDINKMYLDIIQSEKKAYDAECYGTVNKKDFTAPECLELKVGAQVLVCANGGGLYNGMLGEVTELTDDVIHIKDKDGLFWSVVRYTWESFDYTLKGKSIERTMVGKYKQFPLKLAFALNAHKTQGLSLDAIYLDVGSGSFTTGQFYVALSRLRTFEGLGLKRSVTMSEVKVDPVVTAFFEVME